MGSLHCVKGLYMGVRWQLDTLETRLSDESVSPGSLREDEEHQRGELSWSNMSLSI